MPGICKVIQCVKGQARSSPLGPMWGTEVPGGEKPTDRPRPAQQHGASRASHRRSQGPEGRSQAESSLLAMPLRVGAESLTPKPLPREVPAPGLTAASHSDSWSSREGGGEGWRCRRQRHLPPLHTPPFPKLQGRAPAPSHFSFQQPSPE